MATRLDAGRYCSPLEELKELLRRTSQVERSLYQIDAPDDEFGAPGKSSRQQGTGAERPEVCHGPDSEWQEVGQDDGAVHGDSREGNVREQKRGNLHGVDYQGQKWSTGTRRAQPPARNAVSRPRPPDPGKDTLRRRPDLQAKPLISGRSIPRTPLAVTMAKHQQAEAEFLKERVQLKREVDQQRKRASGLEHRYSQLQTLYKHQGAELKSLKAALEQRDAQVEEFETQLQREHVEASTSVSSFQQQIASLKGERNELQQLLSAALHQLQEGRPSSGGSCQEHPQDEARQLLEKVEKQLQEAADRLEWQQENMDNLLQTQLKHNRSKANSIADLLKETASTDVT